MGKKAVRGGGCWWGPLFKRGMSWRDSRINETNSYLTSGEFDSKGKLKTERELVNT